MRIVATAFAMLLLAVITGFASADSPNGEAGKSIPQILADVQSAAGGAELFKGKWIEASATSGQFASLTSLTSISTFFHQVLGSHGRLVEGKTTMIRGRPAFALVDTTEGGTLFIAATGPPYPLEVTSPGGKGAVRFEDWNQPVRLAVPPNPISLASLKG